MLPEDPASDRLADYRKGTPTREALERLADRWTVLIVCVLEDGPARFGEIKRRLEDISGQVLSRMLRDLERDGIVSRHDYAEVPAHVEYALTEFGMTLCPIVHHIRAWAEQWAGQVQASQQRYDHGSGDAWQ